MERLIVRLPMAPRDALVKSGLLMSRRNVKDEPAVFGTFTLCDIKHDNKDAMFITGSLNFNDTRKNKRWVISLHHMKR